MDLLQLKKQLIEEEGYRQKLYTDTVGKVTIGVGHNLTDNGLSARIVDLILEEDINEAIADLNTNVPWWTKLDDVRQNAVIDLVFNMGISSFLKFHKMNFSLENGDFANAASELKNSAWYSQVGTRGPKLFNMILLGRYGNSPT